VDRPGVAWLDPAQALADIRFARPLANLVIVCPHWGVEYALKPSRTQVKLAHQMIDAGADLIVGSHPHVVQPLENYHDHWIAYSLGNFIFDQENPATHRGLMLRVTVRDQQIAEVLPIAIKINSSFQAVLAPVDERSPRPFLAERSPGPLRAGE
jgi:poly-gamma-glutamate synthesis protein (capsule biosynthesis protein)